jgi:hypothetical protein
VGSILVLILLTLLIAVIEMLVLQLLAWGDFYHALKTAIVMNMASSLVCTGLLFLVPRPELWGLGIAWLLSVIIEGNIMLRVKPGVACSNWTAAIIVNLVSYLLLIVPAYLFAGSGR